MSIRRELIENCYERYVFPLVERKTRDFFNKKIKTWFNSEDWYKNANKQLKKKYKNQLWEFFSQKILSAFVALIFKNNKAPSPYKLYEVLDKIDEEYSDYEYKDPYTILSRENPFNFSKPQLEYYKLLFHMCRNAPHVEKNLNKLIKLLNEYRVFDDILFDTHPEILSLNKLIKNLVDGISQNYYFTVGLFPGDDNLYITAYDEQ